MLLKGLRSPQPQPIQTLQLGAFPHGLKTYDPDLTIAPTEASKLVNVNLRKGGRPVSRWPITRHSSCATTNNTSIIQIEEVVIGGTSYTIAVDSNNKPYYLDSGNYLVEITGTLEGATQIIPYNGVALLYDTGYIKYLDGVSTVKLAYDAGTGTTGYQFDNTSDTDSSSFQLGDGTNSRVAQKFTTQSWTSGYTIPPVTVSCYLTKEGSPTGSITVTIRRFSDSVVMATKTFLSDVSTLTGTATEYSATFASTDITTEMDPSTPYYCSLEHTGGDAGNCVHVHYNTVTSGGLAYLYTGTWAAQTTENLLMSLSPGRPPKASWGDVFNNRPWAGGGTNTGYIYYGNLTHLDWSTSNGGGYIGLVDDNATNFDGAGCVAHYGNLYVFGKEVLPYLVVISGSTPSSYTQSLAYQEPWTTHQTLLSVKNDIWFGSGDGMSFLKGVELYGDIRTYPASEQVYDRFEDYWNSGTAFAEYYPNDGQPWLVMPTYHRVLVWNSHQPVVGPEGVGVRYPCFEYEFYLKELTSSTYRWVSTGAGTNEYECQLAAGGDPSFDAKPQFITLDGKKITEGTAGSLGDHEWDYALDQTGTFYTVHVRDESGDPDSTSVDIREIFLPTSLANTSNGLLMGGNDGYTYLYDSSEYKDRSTIQIKPKIQTTYFEIPFNDGHFTEMHLLASSDGGGTVVVDFYTNERRVTYTQRVTKTLGIRDDFTKADMIMDKEDATFPKNMDISSLDHSSYVNFNARTVKAEITVTRIAGYPVHYNGILLKYRGLST